jgi:hypothetical protein
MTDKIHPAALLQITPETTCEDVAAKVFAHHAALIATADAVNAANKRALFTALAGAGIATLVVTYDGYGDEGTLEAPEAFDAHRASVEVPGVEIEIQSTDCDALTVLTHRQPLADALETVAYDMLEQRHSGWENNDGASGEFTFDVVQQSIHLLHRAHYIAHDISEYEC